MILDMERLRLNAELEILKLEAALDDSAA